MNDSSNDQLTNIKYTSSDNEISEYIKTQVINVKVLNLRPKYNNLAEWIKNKDENIYIGRKGVIFIDGVRFPLYDSIWANPFKINENQSRDEVLRLYSEYIEKKLESDNNLVNELLKLKGKKLGCWCKPECCHGDILIDLIKKYDK
jgi:hypothetical protein